jgi:hypothetical protein
LNVQCLRTKIDSVEVFVDDEKLDILCVAEHWLENDELPCYKVMGNLVLADGFCRNQAKNGGTAIYVNKCLNFKIVDLKKFCVEKTFEVVAIRLTDCDIVIASVYRSPLNALFKEFCDALEKCLVHLSSLCSNVIMCGDFNVNVIVESNEEKSFKYLVKQCGFFITNTIPTRGETCIDNILTTLDQWRYGTQVVAPLISDHDAIIMEVQTKPVSTPLSLSWHKEYDFNFRPGLSRPDAGSRLKHALKLVDWDLIFSDGERDTFQVFFKKLQEVFDQCFPVKTLKGGGKNQARKVCAARSVRDWYTPELTRIRDLMLFLRDLGDKPRYLALKKFYNKSVEEARRVANADFIESAPNKCKAAWSVVKDVRGVESGMVCTASPDEFNDYFISSVEDIIKNIARSPTDPIDALQQMNIGPHCSFRDWKLIDVNELLSTVSSMKNSTSRDCYGWSTSLLKEVVEVIADPLTKVINGCLAQGTFPDDLKRARTVPIYKKGDKAAVSSFRPISILPVLGKLLEKIMKVQVYRYFEENRLLSDSQFGFRKNRSTASAVAKISTIVEEAFEVGDSVSLTLCDLSRAFDCVPHDVLIKKLQCYGVGGLALATFKNYLSLRTQKVTISGADSRERVLSCGVPQGSVLGPFLFLVLINDIDVEGRATLFADDTTLIAKAADLQTVIELAKVQLSEAQEWFQSNMLQLNETKTQRLVCTLSRAQVEHNLPVKLLGFHLDSRLNWNHHAASVCNKLARVNCLLRRLRKCVSEEYLVMVYHALFHAHIAYGLHLWGHASDVGEVLKMQKKALRIITHSGFREHCKPIFVRLGILTVVSHFIFACLIEVKGRVQTLSTRSDIHSYSTRSRHLLDVPRARLGRTLNSFPTIAVKFYNKLPATLKNLEDRKFKESLRRLLVERPYYRVQEFLDDRLE